MPLAEKTERPYSDPPLSTCLKESIQGLLGEESRIGNRREQLKQLEFTERDIEAISAKAPKLDVVVLQPSKDVGVDAALIDLCELRDNWSKPAVMKFDDKIYVAGPGDTPGTIRPG